MGIVSAVQTFEAVLGSEDGEKNEYSSSCGPSVTGSVKSQASVGDFGNSSAPDFIYTRQ